ncbi:MAG TPA: toprim domain-containing protein [Methanosarcinaceae archaeon]|nr:toprim domain-containing protein [Methanosarcinaceae archaeon]
MVNISVYRKRLELLDGIFDEIIERSEAGAVIIVEGKRDVLSLEKLGIKGRIETSTRQPLIYFAEKLAQDTTNIIIMTDWDRRGDILADKITIYLQNIGIMPDLAIRKRISSLVKREIKDVESLYSYMVKLKRITGEIN